MVVPFSIFPAKNPWLSWNKLMDWISASFQ